MREAFSRESEVHMPRAKREVSQKPVYEYSDPGVNYLNGEPLEGELPQWAMDKIAERLSRVVSEYISQPEHARDREIILRDCVRGAGKGA